MCAKQYAVVETRIKGGTGLKEWTEFAPATQIMYYER
jgi:hypothetical protein